MDQDTYPGLQIDEHLGFQRRLWKVQKIAFWVLAALLVGAVLGFFGPGLISYKEEQDSAGQLQAKYHRWLRFGSPGMLQFEIQGGSTSDGKAQIWIDRKYVEAVQIESIVPEPESVKAGEDRFLYEFDLEDSQRSAGILFHFVPRESGPLEGQAALGGNTPVEIGQFVYP